jgi:hypothetical protein
MQRKWYLAAFGAALLGTLTSIHSGLPQASAASMTTRVAALPGSLTHTHLHLYPPFNDGYTAGYNDCGNQLPNANPYWRGNDYLDGYNQGYSFCQSKRAQGSIEGNQAGYNAGYQQCQQEHTQPIIQQPPTVFDFAPPRTQGNNAAFGPGFQQGYDACQQQYGGQ